MKKQAKKARFAYLARKRRLARMRFVGESTWRRRDGAWVMFFHSTGP